MSSKCCNFFIKIFSLSSNFSMVFWKFAIRSATLTSSSFSPIVICPIASNSFSYLFKMASRFNPSSLRREMAFKSSDPVFVSSLSSSLRNGWCVSFVHVSVFFLTSWFSLVGLRLFDKSSVGGKRASSSFASNLLHERQSSSSAITNKASAKSLPIPSLYTLFSLISSSRPFSYLATISSNGFWDSFNISMAFRALFVFIWSFSSFSVVSPSSIPSRLWTSGWRSSNSSSPIFPRSSRNLSLRVLFLLARLSSLSS